MNKEQIIDHIQHLINEHYNNGYIIEWSTVENCTDNETSLYYAYDVGRYETLKNLLLDIIKSEV